MHSTRFVIPRSISAYIRGRDWLLLVVVCFLALLFSVAPAQAQVVPPSNFSVPASTGVASWSAVSNASDYYLELEVRRSGLTTTLRPGSHVTSVDFKIAPNATNCCVNGELYRSRIRVVVNSASSDWSSWVNFTFTGSSTITATLVPTPPPPANSDDSDDSDDSSGSSKRATPAARTVPFFPTQDHSQLPAGAEVQSESRWIAFREVSGDAIGNADVREAAISAIDVWGPVGVDALVCFDGAGSLLLLDAAYSPRRLVWLDAYQRDDGKTCARLDRAGTLVLMPMQPGMTLVTPVTPDPIATAAPTTRRHWTVIADSLDQMRTLENCLVSASELLNFRDRPAGRVPRLYIGQSRAIARTDNWFQVEYFGRTGWISAHYVTTEGDCD